MRSSYTNVEQADELRTTENHRQPSKFATDSMISSCLKPGFTDYKNVT